MKYYLLTFICLAGYLVVNVLSASVEDAEWSLFKQTYGRQYASHEEELKRRNMFAETRRILDEFNAKQSEVKGFSLGVNQFSDRTEKEISRSIGLRMPENKFSLLQNDLKAQKFLDNILNNTYNVPNQVDWRKVPDRVTSVKDQGDCASSWAFAAAGTLEGQEVARNKSALTLSAQYLVDCVLIDAGCVWGWPIDAFSEVYKRGGIPSDESYPFEFRDGNCRLNEDHFVFTDNGYAVLPEGDEETLKRVVAKFGPVSVKMDATETFMNYKSGVFNDEKCYNSKYNLIHSLLIVGYGTDPKYGDYWIAKNSFGFKWGENGYIRLSRNKKNQCGVATVAALPVFY